MAQRTRKIYGSSRILRGMQIWRRLGPAPSVSERTPEQQAWDSAVLATVEYLRRIYNKEFMECFDMLTEIKKGE